MSYYLSIDSFGSSYPPVNLEAVAPYYDIKINEVIANFYDTCQHFQEYGFLTSSDEKDLQNELENVWNHFCSGDYSIFSPEMPTPIYENE